MASADTHVQMGDEFPSSPATAFVLPDPLRTHDPADEYVRQRILGGQQKVAVGAASDLVDRLIWSR